MIGLSGCLLARLAYLQVFKYLDYRQMASRQQLTPRESKGSRGMILDRNGDLLAMNIELYNVGAHPERIRDRAKAAAALSQVLGLSYAEVAAKLSSRRTFVWVARQVPYERSAAVERLNIKGIEAFREERRFYPDHEMAAHVLGFAGMDNQGLDGLENRYDSSLSGKDGYEVNERDARGKLVLTRSSKGAKDGLSVVTTLDRTVQHITQVELEKAFLKYRCKAASAIVMDTRTGEILALANYPAFDPNRFKAYGKDVWRNRSVAEAFEPGSTFKLVVAAAALEEGEISEDDQVFCENGKFIADYGRVITDHDKRGWLSFREVFGYSSNIGMVKVGKKLGRETLYNYAKRFGFGDATGIDLPGEALGLMNPPRKWSGLTISSLPYGYEVAATPLQVLCAYSAVANGGTMMKPYMVRRLEDREGRVVREFAPKKLRKSCSSRTAKRLTGMLQWVVEKGTGTAVALPSYPIAGKTGTSHKLIKGRYSPYNYVSSFVGFVPADNPQYAIYVSLDDPRGLYWGGYTAGPVFKEVAKRILSYGVVPTAGEGAQALAPKSRTIPAFLGLTEDQCRRVGDRAGVRLSFDGKGRRVVGQSLAAGSRVQQEKKPPKVELRLGEREERAAGGGSMPDLKGKTKRQALALLSPLGLRVNFTGRGVVKSQLPLAGSSVPAGGYCELHCDLPVIQVTEKAKGGNS